MQVLATTDDLAQNGLLVVYRGDLLYLGPADARHVLVAGVGAAPTVTIGEALFAFTGSAVSAVVVGDALYVLTSDRDVVAWNGSTLSTVGTDVVASGYTAAALGTDGSEVYLAYGAPGLVIKKYAGGSWASLTLPAVPDTVAGGARDGRAAIQPGVALDGECIFIVPMYDAGGSYVTTAEILAVSGSTVESVASPSYGSNEAEGHLYGSPTVFDGAVCYGLTAYPATTSSLRSWNRGDGDGEAFDFGALRPTMLAAYGGSLYAVIATAGGDYSLYASDGTDLATWAEVYDLSGDADLNQAPNSGTGKD